MPTAFHLLCKQVGRENCGLGRRLHASPNWMCLWSCLGTGRITLWIYQGLVLAFQQNKEAESWSSICALPRAACQGRSQPLLRCFFKHSSLSIKKCICPVLYTSIYSNFLNKKLIFAVICPVPFQFPEKKLNWISQGRYWAPTSTQKLWGFSQLALTAEFNSQNWGWNWISCSCAHSCPWEC